MYRKITAEFEVVTPMFIGDGRHKASSIRPSSIKGALRFWWRALNWEGIYRDVNNEAQALDELRRQEIALFGGVADKSNDKAIGGQGVASVRVVKQNTHTHDWNNETTAGVGYLLGQGLHHFKKGPTRESFSPGSTFTLELVLKNASIEQELQLENVTKVFGLIGGLGSRNRRGIGSVIANKITTHKGELSIPSSPNEYLDELKSVFSGYSSISLPPISAFTNLSFSDLSTQSDSWLSCLDTVGRTQQMYRSYGRASYGKPHKVGKLDALKLFADDHDLVLDIINRRDQSGKHPKRMVFGLPHNYFYASKQKMDIAGEAPNSRRASPLFVHVHKLGPDQYVALQMCIPAQFYPEKGKIKYFKTGRSWNASDIDWQVIKDYMRLDEYTSKVNSHSYPGFTSRTVIQEGLDHE